MSSRKEIRSLTIGAKKVFKSKLIKYEGIEIEIREPSVKVWGELLRNVTNIGDVEEGEKASRADTDKYLIWSVICCSYVPGTDERVFEDTDYDSLSACPRSGFIGEFSDIAMTMMNADVETSEKNSDATATEKAS